MTRELRFVASERAGEVSALLQTPDDARALLVLGHGAGAGMRHRFMDRISDELGAVGVATFRYQFPYMEQGRRGPNPPKMLQATVRAAVHAAAGAAPGLPLLAGGKSMGGRMTSLAAAAEPLPGVKGLVFFGFPLHAAGKPGTERGAHLRDVTVPTLFLQGTRDRLADLDLLRPICEEIHATLHIVETGDHSFKVLKSAGRTEDDVLEELARTVADWMPLG